MRIAIEPAGQSSTLKANGKSFYVAGWFLGQEDFKRATALYAHLRDIDDQIDEAADSETAAKNLKAILAELDNPIDDEQDHLEIDTATMHAFLRGMAYDIGEVAIHDQSELEDYCYCVAGTVGEMMCQALRCDDPRAISHAIDMGVAMQMTNIARDVYEDAERGRLYVPKAWLGDISCEDILQPSAAAETQIRSAILCLIALSEKRYQTARHGIALLPVRSRLAILAASYIYGGIGRAIRKEQAQNWQSRMVISKPQKLKLVLVSIAKFVTSSSLWSYRDGPSVGKPEQSLRTLLDG